MKIAELIGLTNVVVWIWALLNFIQGDISFVIVLSVMSVIVDVLKNIFKIPRPDGACACDALGIGGKSTSYGMPSGHVATAVIGWYFIAKYILVNTTFSTKISTLIPFEILLSLVAGFAMTWARYSVGCHTIGQGLAGMITSYIIIYTLK